MLLPAWRLPFAVLGFALLNAGPAGRHQLEASIKLTTDAGAKAINPKPKVTTLSAIMGMQRPAGMPASGKRAEAHSKRYAPLETTVWQLDVHVSRIELREDGDFYLVIEDGKGAGTVAELPDPALCKGSPFLAKITDVRKMLAKQLGPSPRSKAVSRRARLTGIGYFGKSRLSDATHNGARIQPLLSVKWLDAQ